MVAELAPAYMVCVETPTEFVPSNIQEPVFGANDTAPAPVPTTRNIAIAPELLDVKAGKVIVYAVADGVI